MNTQRHGARKNKEDHAFFLSLELAPPSPSARSQSSATQREKRLRDQELSQPTRKGVCDPVLMTTKSVVVFSYSYSCTKGQKMRECFRTDMGKIGPPNG
jgi:hypothetical protein